MDRDMQKQLDFILEVDKLKNIFRQTHLSGNGRSENDAEHSWHMALMAYILKEYANEEVDIAKVMLMCLIHDIVEIDAGDTYAYDTDGARTKKARENAAKIRLFSILPEKQCEEFTALFDEFEECETPEARFAHAMDNIQPAMLNDASGGKSWLEHGVRFEQISKRNAKTKEGSQVLWDYALEHIFKPNIEKGNILE